jgi:hypothetical protein
MFRDKAIEVMNFFSRKWLIINEEAACKRMTNFTDSVELRNEYRRIFVLS